MTRVRGIDVGTSSARAQIFEADAAEREPARREYAGENDPVRVAKLVREAIDEASGGGEDSAAVAGSCFGHSLIAVDENGRPLTPILGWRDTRSADSAAWLARRVDAAGGHARTGRPTPTRYWPGDAR